MASGRALKNLLIRLEAEFPGLRAQVYNTEDIDNRPIMLPFEVSHDSRIVRAINEACQTVRGRPQPTGPIKTPCS